MKNLWSDSDAAQTIARYEAAGFGEDLALRVYTSRLLGREPHLVLHGGGNTSVKTRLPDLVGEETEVLCVKGSGWDLSTIEPAGLPAVRLAPLRQARAWDSLSDEDMVALQRANLLDPAAPNPSVETLLHAYLPHKFVDHAHAPAVLALSNQPNGAELCREVFGTQFAFVPYVMPGFALAKVTADAVDALPEVSGVILHKHGIFTFGDSAQQSYERMIDAVSEAEAYIKKSRRNVLAARQLPGQHPPVADIAPIIRGACAEPGPPGQYRRLMLDFRTSDEIRRYVDGERLADYGTRGVITPDHNIRIKNKPLVVEPPATGRLREFSQAVRNSVDQYCSAYRDYFDTNNSRQLEAKTQLDPMPRVALVPGVGLFGLGKTPQAARVAADLAELTVTTVTDAEAIGQFEALTEEQLFEMEYWSLEQAKLGKGVEPPLARQIALISGAAGTIGTATARLFADSGAAVALVDRDLDAVREVTDGIGSAAIAIECDVTDPDAVRDAFAQTCASFGGVDILVSNAGAAWQGPIADLSDADLRASFEVNFFAHQNLARRAVQVMKAQQTGGVLLFNASKQAVNPGRNFGAYGLPKAATLFLSRQYALEYGELGIRSNAVNADRVRSGLLTDDMVEHRARQRGVSTQEYLSGNLLQREVKSDDVAQAFLHLALADKTTAAVYTVDGGNIAAALR